LPVVQGGSPDVWRYECNGSLTGYSAQEPDIDFGEIYRICGPAVAQCTPIYFYNWY